MAPTTHLKSFQALELAVREGTLAAAAERLGITPAAVGQRIRALENYLGADLLLRGRSGLQPTRELDLALADLRIAFRALERVTEMLDFQRVTEIHMVADHDWADLWLTPRLPDYRAENPNIKFCINGTGDVPVALGSPDLRIEYGDVPGEDLYRDYLLPMTGPDNIRRIADLEPENQMEGMPIIHLRRQRESPDHPGWVDWFREYGHRESGTDRGLHYPNARLALEAVRENVGFLVSGLSFVQRDLDQGAVVLPFPPSHNIPAPFPFRMTLRAGSENRVQLQNFVGWLRRKSRETQFELDGLIAEAG